MQLDEFRQLMKARQNIYDLLRCFFLQEPSENFLQALREEGLLKDLAGYDPDLDEGVHLLSAMLSSAQLPAYIPDLQIEFTRLFIGPLPVPLYESVYRSKDGLVMQEETLAVRRNYLEAGLLVNPRQSFPDDHIGAELEFVFYLCQRAGQLREADQQEAHLRVQQDFFREHLTGWVPSMCDRLFAEAESPYFKAVAKITKGFVTWDYREIVSHFLEM